MFLTNYYIKKCCFKIVCSYYEFANEYKIILFSKMTHISEVFCRGRLALRETVHFIKIFVFVRGFEPRSMPNISFKRDKIKLHYSFDKDLKKVGVVPQPQSRNLKMTVDDETSA